MYTYKAPKMHNECNENNYNQITKMDFPSVTLNTNRYFTDLLAARFFPTGTALVTFRNYSTISAAVAQGSTNQTVAQQLTMQILQAKSARQPVIPLEVPLNVVIATILMPLVHLKLFGSASSFEYDHKTNRMIEHPREEWEPKIDAACAIYGHAACFHMGKLAYSIGLRFEAWKAELEAEHGSLVDEHYAYSDEDDNDTASPDERQRINSHITGLEKLMDACFEVIHESDVVHERLEENLSKLDDFATDYWRRGYTEIRNGRFYRLMRNEGFWALYCTDGEVESLPLFSFDAFDTSG